MKSVVQFIALLFISGFINAQGVSKKLNDAVRSLEADAQMKSAILGFYVVSQQNGSVVFSENAAIGLPVASSQKVLTCVASLELLGINYRYNTSLVYDGSIENGILNGNLYLQGSGSPEQPDKLLFLLKDL